MFFDFSSAFNTIQPHILGNKLLDFKLHNSTTAWILDYLLNRPQFVRVGGKCSDLIFTNSGAPQGTVLSPFLFTLYTADYRHSLPSCHLQKFSDDTALLGLIFRGDDLAYREEVNSFVRWCDANFLQLNIGKTQELVIDFRKKKQTFSPVVIKGQPVEIVETYKYLGVYLDNKLNWKRNSHAVVKKAQSRLFFLRKLRSFDISRRLLNVFYQGIMASVLFYAVLCWGRSLTAEDKNRINKMIKKSGSVVGQRLDSFDMIIDKRMKRKLKTVMSLEDHPLHQIFKDLGSSFSGRMLMPLCSTERFRLFYSSCSAFLQ
uniref:Reverse transcriptase domain-containing protein n=1 Tax=Nothobranchius pienaari TaxID=704102 RepID=A0A1A8MF94_9TELE